MVSQFRLSYHIVSINDTTEALSFRELTSENNEPSLSSSNTTEVTSFPAKFSNTPTISMNPSNEQQLWELLEEERRTVDLPGGFSFRNNEDVSQFASPRMSSLSAASLPRWSMSEETPWERSTVHKFPTTPLLYHCLASLHRTDCNIFSITVTKNYIVTGSARSRIHAWKQPDCTDMGYIKTTGGEITAILASENLILTAHGDCRLRVWEVSSTDIFRPKKTMTLPLRRSIFSYAKQTIHRHKGPISCLAYNKREKLIYTGSYDHTVKVWKISQKQCVDSFVAHEDCVNAIVINQGDCVFTCSSDCTVKIWRRILNECTHILTMTLKFQPSPVKALALSLSPSDCFLYSGSSDGLISFWKKDGISWRYNHGGFLQGHHFAVLCLVTIENLILSGSEDTTVRIWQRGNTNSLHSCLAVVDGHHGPVKSLYAALETSETFKGLLVYSASLDQTLKVWRVKVYPGQDEKLDESEANNPQLENTESKMSPVLSPSWVEKKIQVGEF